LRELGDISATAPTMDQIRSANVIALKVLKQALQML
jgi:hypothetical protein